MQKGKQTPEEKHNTPPIHEFEEEKIIRERKENPTVKEKLQEITSDLTKDLPKLSIGQEGKEPDAQTREIEITSIRQKTHAEKNLPTKDTSMKKGNTGDEIETVVENLNNHAKGVAHSLHDFVGGKSRSQQIFHVRQRKNKSREIER